MKTSMMPKLFLLILGFLLTHQNSWPILSLFLLFLFYLFAFVLNFLLVPGRIAWDKKNYPQNTSKICGPIGWPLLGSIPLIMGSHAHRNLAAMATSLGAKRLMDLNLGATRVIISSHPETAKEILCGHSFSDRPIKVSARFLMFERAIGFAPSGKYWRHLRRIAATHMFSPRKISGLEGLRQWVANEMMEKILEDMNANGFVEVRRILQKGSLSSVLESVFGSGLGLEREDLLALMVKEGYELISQFNWDDYFPLGFLDFYGVKRRSHNLAVKVQGLVGQIIEDRKKDEKMNERNDFLSSLLSLPKEDQLSHADMVAVLWEMIFRGTDTVAILVEWIMARMVLHQEVQAKLQLEIDTCVMGKRHVRDSDIPNLPYLRAVVKEVLRLHPPGPLLSWARIAIHDVQVGEFLVPAGTTAMVNMWAISHDPTIWKDPWAFKPERFIDEDFSIMGSDLRLAPFGSGQRVCPGKALGLASIHLWLARLLQHFKWIPISIQSVDLSECLRLSLEMKKPLACLVVPRST